VDLDALFQARAVKPSVKLPTSVMPEMSVLLDPSSMMSLQTAPSSSMELADMLGKMKGARDDEWERIIHIPRADPPNPQDVAWLHRTHVYELRLIQSVALAAIQKYGGLFGDIGVGHGKSLIGWLAMVVRRAQRGVIMMPPDMVEPYKLDIERFKEHFVRPVVEPIILPYSVLSRADGTDILERLNPDVIVADEAQALANDSARTRRLKRFFHSHPETIFIAMSGTFIRPEMSTLAHLVHYALRDNAFMPVRGRALEVWKECVDLKGRPAEADWKIFEPLAMAEGFDLSRVNGDDRLTMARKSVFHRMHTTPGVVSTTENSCTTPLICTRVQGLAVPPEIQEILDRMKTGEETPDGEDIIADDAQRARLQKHLSMGFYYRWAWEQIGGRDDEWLAKRRAWNRAVRRELMEHSREGYDSEKLVFDSVARQVLENPDLVRGSLLHMLFHEWRQMKDKLKPPTVAVWLNTFMLDWIRDFLAKSPPTLVWYHSDALEEALGKMGLPIYGAGSMPPTKAETCGVAIEVHHKGKNLQFFDHMLVAEPFGKGERWQQLLGRYRRPGQESEQLRAYIMAHTDILNSYIDRGIREAESVALGGGQQHLLQASWEIL
jgi:hypothetical protein